eukprot:TRINITY_DN75276_c0_g1_i1.p1 TRINITY_DN75276_c0_g1~~TRINITY_DN75276_c0_g1_i1.p1  ORF type:complete len:438 (-),score=28.92 TRINITY_DN75276_c0_g1_i1:56-1369(-)
MTNSHSKVDSTTADEGTLNTLYAASFTHLLSAVVLMQSTLGLVTKQCGGESTKVVSTLQFMASSSAASELLLNPLLGTLSDRIGRKNALTLVPIISLLCRYSVLKNPGSMKALYASRIFASALLPAFFTLVSIVATDVYGQHPNRKVKFMKKEMRQGIVMAVGIVVGSILAGKLTAKSVVLPFKVSVMLSALTVMLIQFFCRETIAQKATKPLSLANFNPFSFLTLFTRQGLPKVESPPQLEPVAKRKARKNLRRLYITKALQSIPAFMPPDIPQMYCRSRFGWGPEQIGKYFAVIGVSSFLGHMVSPKFQAACGEHATLASHMAAFFGSTLQGMAFNSSMLYASVGFSMLGVGAPTRVGGAIAEIEGSQGTLMSYQQSAQANMVTVMKIVSSSLHGRLLKKGMAAKAEGTEWMIGLPYLANALIHILAQLAFSGVR